MSEERKGDDVRQTFMEMYREVLSEGRARKEVSSEEDMRDIIHETMILVAMDVRSKANPKLSKKLKKNSFNMEYTGYLFEEFYVLSFSPIQKMEQVFAEYLLLSIMNEFDAAEIIDFGFLRQMLTEACQNASDDEREHIYNFRRLYPWGPLIF